MKRAPLIECIGGPWDGKRIPEQGLEVHVPLLDLPAWFAWGAEPPDTVVPVRRGAYRLEQRRLRETSSHRTAPYASESVYRAYRWLGE